MRARCSTSASDLGIIKKSGAWFTYEGEQLGQGRENVKTFLSENVDLMVEISEKIKDATGIDDVDRRPHRRGGRGRGRRSRTSTPEISGRSRPTRRRASATEPIPGRRPESRALVDWRVVTRRFYVRTYGCQMNEHDSERIAGLLAADGMEPTDDLDEADVVVLNTCCIRENADNKLYGHLGHLKALKDVAARRADRGRRVPRAEGP